MPIKKLFQVSDGILLKFIRDLNNIIPDLYGESTIDELKSIELIGCGNVSCLVKTTDEDATQTFVASNDLMLDQRKTTKKKYFSQVEKICLNELENMKFLFDCSSQYISLRNLQEIEITSLMVLISGGDEQTADDDIEFPRLTHISLLVFATTKELLLWGFYSQISFFGVYPCEKL
ncbi:unnamed protein product [Lactuca saligna]|uniref:Uncharacterized protein n=1 Tax=Lactuca saligna TaxID=75948 RepID=A0AA36EMX1_LACSI|nr:unnamed protein product [Lactuca saligna]